MNYPKGSEWRKWDLHFHTPSSFDYIKKDVTNEEIINGLKTAEIYVVAITDHHFIDVERINKLQELGKSKNIIILSGIELRTDKGGSDSIHMIGIFPEISDIKTIWTKLSGNLNITPEDVKKNGDENVYVNLEDAADLIHELGGIVTIHAGSKTNTIENITNALPHKMAQKKDILTHIDIFEMGKVTDIDDYEKNVIPNIRKIKEPPMIICSDNHNIRNYEFKTPLWIKGDPTFTGLKQATYEPKERVFVGKIPEVLLRVNSNKTKYISSVSVNKTSDSAIDGVWFTDIELKLNTELVAIIGNKGNGKSALVDIIGLLGNTKNYEYFSFLNNDKFRKRPQNLAKNFLGTLTWESNDKDKKILSDNPEGFEVEKVKYIPQKFQEILFNTEDSEDFEQELKKVIFSHVPEPEKLEQLTLDDLVDYKTEIIEQEIIVLQNEISGINKDIINLEDKNTESFKKEIDGKLKEKKKELKTHDKIKPKIVPKPDSDKKIEEQKKITKQLGKLNEKKEKLETSITEKLKKKTKLNKRKEDLSKILQEIDSIEARYNVFVKKHSDYLKNLQIDITKVISLIVNKELIKSKINKTKSEILRINNALDEKKEKSAVNRFKKLNDEIEKLKGKLNEPNKLYQLYLQNLGEWAKTRKGIVGTNDKEGTIEYYKEIQNYLSKQLQKDLELKRKKRLNKIKALFKEKVKIINIYQDLYKPVQTFISEYKFPDKSNIITFDVSLKLKDFKEKFFLHINQGVKGSFYGIEDSEKRLNELIIHSHFNKEDSLVKFLENIIDLLENDCRFDNAEKRIIKKQIKGEFVADFYDFLFPLDYLIPHYRLKYGHRNLSTLSPGEKGALMLIFYLLLDRDNCPLIIDQPEENLDNQSVYKILVPFIKQAKKRRQIIIVTHNPNLAVVCDADQTIYATIDKTKKNTVNYFSGSIENPEINQYIVDVLEGTLPAFNNRDKKYTVTKLANL